MSCSSGCVEVCDCHSHVYGPYARFPLSNDRTFDPPEAAIELLEEVWKSHGISRAVLIQGSVHGNDHCALLEGIARDPARRRGVAILRDTVSDEELNDLDRCGVRGVRFNWVKHLLHRSARSPTSMLNAAASLASRVFSLGWHVEVHVDPESLDMVEQLEASSEQVVVIDHMARVDGSLGVNQPAFRRLQRLLERKHVWVKLSGADRVAGQASLSAATALIASLVEQAPDRCVWGLDWPHVNLARAYDERELLATFEEAVPDPDARIKILSENPARLYGFPPFDQDTLPTAINSTQGATVV